jgi:peroxiredoxin
MTFFTKISSKHWIAAALALAAAGLLATSFVRAIADSETRRFEAPLRAMLGDESFEALRRGEPTELHYLGNNRVAPDFTLPDRHGRAWRLSARRGKLVIMNFWSVTCPPCIEELPSLEYLAQMIRGRTDMELVTISTDQDWEAIKKVLPPHPSFAVLFDPDKRVVRDKFGTRMYPETWVIDSEGIIRFRVDGARDWSDPVALAAIALFL